MLRVHVEPIKSEVCEEFVPVHKIKFHVAQKKISSETFAEDKKKNFKEILKKFHTG